MSRNDLVSTAPIPRDLIKDIAKDLGKDLVAYLEFAWPKIFETYPQSTFKLSLRNHTYNMVMNAVKLADEGKVEGFLKFNEKHRRTMRKLRKAKTVEDIINAHKDS